MILALFVPPLVLAKLIGVGLPLLVALVTKARAKSWEKAIVLAFLAALSGVLTAAAATGGQIVLKSALDDGLTAWIMGVATYFGLWKTTAAPAIAARTGSFGVGTDQGVPVEVPEPPDAAAAPRARVRTKKVQGR